MPLFQPKIIEKALARKKIEIIPAVHLQILDEWKSSIDSGSLLKQTEVAIHAPFTHKIMVDVLGYKPFGGDAWSISREYGVAGGAVDLALGHFSDDKAGDRVIAPFELKGAKTTIPLADRNDWQDYFESEQRKISGLNQQIKQLEQQLDQAVYDLFDLTAEEIELLQQNI